MKLYLALVHYPIKSKDGKIINTSVTNLDIHDIARSARTYSVEEYHIVTPLKVQHRLIKSIIDHWNEDEGNAYNPDRSEALSFVRYSESLEESVKLITQKEGKRPLIAVTAAGLSAGLEARELIGYCNSKDLPCILVFGTGWGLADEVLERADLKLNGISGSKENEYNHLSVRAAAAIYLDRIYS